MTGYEISALSLLLALAGFGAVYARWSRHRLEEENRHHPPDQGGGLGFASLERRIGEGLLRPEPVGRARGCVLREGECTVAALRAGLDRF